MSEIEKWKPVVGYEGWYDVSDKGRIRRIRRGSGTCPGKILKPCAALNGYLHVTLSKDGNNKGHTVHRLVAVAFVPNKGNKPDINHLDGDKTNQSPSNLSWCTKAENQRHSINVLGNLPFRKRCYGENHGRTKLKNEEVLEIKELLNKKGISQVVIARRYKTTQATISRIKLGTGWSHIINPKQELRNGQF